MNTEQHNTPLNTENPSRENEDKNQSAKPVEPLMDYEEFAERSIPETALNQIDIKIGLVGGQSSEDEGGLDVSRYTGPNSKASGEFKNQKAPYHSGPGNPSNED